MTRVHLLNTCSESVTIGISYARILLITGKELPEWQHPLSRVPYEGPI